MTTLDASRRSDVHRLPSTSWIQAYYWATALFVLADVAFGANVRAAALPRTDLRYLYYLLCFGCAFVCTRWPRAAPWVGMGESALNIFLLMLSVMLPIIALPDTVFTDGAGLEPMSLGRIVNFIFTGTVLWLSFQRSQALAAGSSSWIKR